MAAPYADQQLAGFALAILLAPIISRVAEDAGVRKAVDAVARLAANDNRFSLFLDEHCVVGGVSACVVGAIRGYATTLPVRRLHPKK